MLRALSGFNLSTFLEPLQRARVSAGPARHTQPRPGADTLHLSQRGRNLSEVRQGTEVSAPRAADKTPAVSSRPGGVHAHQGVQTAASRPTPGPVQPTDSDSGSLMDRFNAAFFTSEGDEAFDASVDLNSDGRINLADMAVHAANENAVPAPRPEPMDEVPMSMMDRMQASFFTSAGDRNFDAGMDLNSDGRINFGDLAMAAADEVTRMRERMSQAFFTSEGDAGFASDLDLNGDGRINFADLSALSDKAQNAYQGMRPPSAPVPPQPVVHDGKPIDSLDSPRPELQTHAKPGEGTPVA